MELASRALPVVAAAGRGRREPAGEKRERSQRRAAGTWEGSRPAHAPPPAGAKNNPRGLRAHPGRRAPVPSSRGASPGAPSAQPRGAGRPARGGPGAPPRPGPERPPPARCQGGAAGDPRRPGHADAPPAVSPRRVRERRRGSLPGSQLPNGRRAPAPPRPPGARWGLKRRREAHGGQGSRPVTAAVAEVTHNTPSSPSPPPKVFLRGAALPPTGRGDPPRAPGPTSSRPGLPLEVAAVAAGLGHRAAGTSQPSGQRPTGPGHPRPH